jgi:hypothetical protein
VPVVSMTSVPSVTDVGYVVVSLRITDDAKSVAGFVHESEIVDPDGVAVNPVGADGGVVSGRISVVNV